VVQYHYLSRGGFMNLQLLCRINAVWVALNGLSAFVVPDMWFNMAGYTAGPAAYAAAQGLGVSFIGLGLISWRTSDIAGEAINLYGQLFGIIWILFALLALYQMMTGLFSGPAAIFNLVVSLIFAALFFYSSRKTE
tara:strand:- start:345 stop:752 length:408 start_codon:yes stop_codon:yes gene_type:complete